MSALRNCLAILAGLCVSVSAIDLVVETTHGPVRGIRSEVSALNVTYFRAIPYAEPPVGDLRFSKPVDKEPWDPDHEFDATKFGVSCPQPMEYGGWMKEVLPSEEVDEDCLQLNIYVPNEEPEEPYAVMVWIHGGGFVIGQGMLYESSALSSLYGVIVVTINYRLGALGFISTKDEHLPGNYGLHDQILALRWVKNNAAFFGGDPNRITIFGESAGGFSCSILSHTSLIQGEELFHRAISQSGTLFPGIVPPVDMTIGFSETVGENLGCEDVEDHAKLVECLRDATYEEIVEAQAGTILVPVTDDEIITEPVEDFVQNGVFKDYDIMVGSNSFEGTLMLPILPDPLDPTDDGLAEPVFRALIAGQVHLFFEQNEDKLTDAALFQYTEWNDPDNGHVRTEKYNEFFSDLTFLAPTVANARLHAPPPPDPPQPPTDLPPLPIPIPLPFPVTGMQLNIPSNGQSRNRSPKDRLAVENQKKTYHYFFDFRPSFYTGPSYVSGASHAMEIPFVFSHTLEMHAAPFVNTTIPAEELFLSKQMSSYWTNFAKSGNPNEPDGKEYINDVEWKAFDNEDQYLHSFLPEYDGG
ncbi:neuroligin-4, X-linked-like [Ptychodera flava]|uniref:neuroligin-4, X-linked-like n=1 Tax=Ptychodera flava TaxID=63121 RepID=UPI00396A2900